jgi:hypothetical protein
MAVPELLYNFPSDGDSNVPVGEAIVLAFSNLVDPERLKSSVILVGKVRDRVVGAAISTLTAPVLGDGKYFMKSPGFSGTVPLKFTFQMYDTEDATRTPVDTSVVDRAGEDIARLGSLVSIVPEGGALAPEMVYTLYINGDTESTGLVGVSARTLYDVVPNPSNASTDGRVHVAGTWSGTGSDTLHIKMTTDGNPGTATYKWWYESRGVGTARTGNMTARRYRNLVDGIQVRFGGSSFVEDDEYTFFVHEKERMAGSFSIGFTTNDGSWTTAPTEPSVPASTVPETILETEATYLEVLEMDPEHTSYNVRNGLRIIKIYFSEDIDPETITEETVKLWKAHVDGHYQNTYEPKQLRYEYEVDGNMLILKF